jgi:hypothetical protein
MPEDMPQVPGHAARKGGMAGKEADAMSGWGFSNEESPFEALRNRLGTNWGTALRILRRPAEIKVRCEP